jgi:hypothetical protein
LLIKKLEDVKGDHKHTNLSLSGFTGDPTEAKGIIYKAVMVGRKIVPTTFSVVDVKGRYNGLLRWDWIHTNECVPSTLHQCVIQWIRNEVKVVQAHEEVFIAMSNLKSTSWAGRWRGYPIRS